MKSFFHVPLVLFCIAAAPSQTTKPSTQPQQHEEILLGSANKKLTATLTDLRRDSSVVYFRLMAEIERSQRHAEAQQEQARLELASRITLAYAKLMTGPAQNVQQLRQGVVTELTQAMEFFNKRLAEIDAEQNQTMAQAVQKFAQQKAELLNSYPRELIGTMQRLTQELSAIQPSQPATEFKVELPPFARLSTADDKASEKSLSEELESARGAYSAAMKEARSKVLETLDRSLALPAEKAEQDEQLLEIRNTIKRLGLWAADAMDTYQIGVKAALRKYQLGDPATAATKQR
jgi:hypothetical protein